MGYTKIVQFGNVTEIYDYEKNRPDYKPRYVSELTKKRQKQTRLHEKSKGSYSRSKRSIKRSTDNFFRLCHHNNYLADTVHFVTLTFAYDLTYKEASRHVAHWFQRIKKNYPAIPISYISVPEITKKGRFHFHLLVYDLPPETASVERKTRNFQRLFQRGYVDISPATYLSEGIAGYMAKYMAKALTDEKNETTRGYTCSRNIKKIFSASGNTLCGYTDMIIPTTDVVNSEKKVYDVPYLGKCVLTKITKN
jgi:hypothetical protein